MKLVLSFHQRSFLLQRKGDSTETKSSSMCQIVECLAINAPSISSTGRLRKHGEQGNMKNVRIKKWWDVQGKKDISGHDDIANELMNYSHSLKTSCSPCPLIAPFYLSGLYHHSKVKHTAVKLPMRENIQCLSFWASVSSLNIIFSISIQR